MAAVPRQGWGPGVTHPRSWALWTAPPAVSAWVTVIVALAAAVAGAGLLATEVKPAQVAAWLVLTGCGAVCVEAVRRVGEPAGVAKDLLSAWTLPVALLLPPVYSLLIPLPLMLLMQLRVRRGLVYRRTYSIAAIGLSNWVVSVGFHRYLQWHGTHLPGGALVGRTAILLVAVGCAALGCAVNLLLIGIAVRLASPEATWRELIVDREQRIFDVGEICLGVAVAGCWVLTPALALTMLVPVLLVQRSLTHGQLRAAARTDSKTGLLNAKAWQEEAEREIVRARRERQPLAVVVADLDYFKRVNDAHGHLAGDVALTAAVTALSGALRPYDQLGRFGGEEFTAVLPRTGRVEASRIAERLRTAVAAVPLVLDDIAVGLSVSIGVAILGDHGNDLTDLLAAADHALYRAKQAGRNTVAVAL
ncbi:MAG: GGDEF domain-containing protein [Actinomycetota bacterium]|nr:GGDEF domain-containing protein [Actinomycetota bacterium]